MNARDAMALVGAIEDLLPVCQWRLHGVQIWPLVRSRIVFAAFDEGVGTGWHRGGMVARIGRRMRTMASALTSIFRDATRGSGLAAPADVLIVTDCVSTAQVEGRFFDVLGDPLRQLVEAAGCTAATWYVSYACPEPRHTRGTLIQWRLDAAQAARLLLRREGAPDTNPERYDEFLAMLHRAGLPEQALALNRMRQLALRVAVMAERLGAWLTVSRPRLVFVNCYYSLEGAALVLACKRVGILCVDVQHGVQGDLHVAYGSWRNAPEAGYDLLPDRFWCWSEREVRAIESWSRGRTSRHLALVGGNPWLEMWRNEAAAFTVDAQRRLDSAVPAGRRLVLVTLQWGMGDDAFFHPVMDLIARAGGDWFWLLRLHPVMRARKQDIQTAVQARQLLNVLVDDSSDFAMPAVLRRACLHVTYNSSVVLEAAAMGVASMVTSPDGETLFKDLVDSGRVVVVPQADAELGLRALEALASNNTGSTALEPAAGSSALRALLEESGRNTTEMRRPMR